MDAEHVDTRCTNAGHTDAERLVRTYADTILRLCYTYLHSTADAEDICQDTLIKLIQKREPFRSTEHERAWVIRVTINACKDILRREGKVVSLEPDEANELEAPTYVDEARQTARNQSVLETVMSLPVAYREAVYLHYYEGYTVHGIALLTNATDGAVSQRLSRARKQLKTALGGVDFLEGDFDD